MQPPNVHCIDVPSGACIGGCPAAHLPAQAPRRSLRSLLSSEGWRPGDCGPGGGGANPPRAPRPLSHHVRLPNLCNEPSALRACASGHNLTPARPASA